MASHRHDPIIPSESRVHLGFHSARSSIPNLPESSWTLTGFLAHVQFNYVDFLPITWHPAMDQVGTGGTASLRERLVNISLSFVFKRIHPRHFPQHTKQTAEILAFKLLVKEMYVARHRDLVDCENVVCLEGISWDIEDDGHEKAWPVLVYEKANYGSIKKFIMEKSSGVGMELSFDERLELCAQLARGIGCMHRAGIIHGDVKPDNVVVFENSKGGFTAKITDFGYSTVCIDISQDGSLLRNEGSLESGIYLTKPSIWSHPDRHDDSYDFQEAVLEEVYTFGMTCFWVLFNHHAAYPDQDELRKRKRASQMPVLALELALSSGVNLTDNQVAFMQLLFGVTLAHDKNERATFPEIISLFETGSMPTKVDGCQSFNIVIPHHSEMKHPTFQLLDSVSQLVTVDFRVRAYIRQCISTLLQELKEGTAIYRHSHLQMAYCYALGFGGEASKEKRDMHLQRADASLSEVEEQVHELRQVKGSVFFSGKFRDAMTSGLVPPLDLAQALRDVTSSSDLITPMKQEIESLEEVLGSTNTNIVHMKANFARLLVEHGHVASAREMLSSCLNALETSAREEDNLDRLFIKAQLADAEVGVGRWKEAETLAQEVLEESIAIHGESHAETVVVKNQLALILADQGRWDEAVSIQKAILQYQEERLGSNHPITLQFTSSLVQSLIELGNYAEAEHWMKNIATVRDAVWGRDSPETLLSLMDEARLLEAKGCFKDAESLEREALEGCKRSLGQDHLYTLDGTMNLAQSLVLRYELEEAEQLAEECVVAYTRTRGAQHPDTLRSMGSLAMVYKEHGKWREAERTDRCALQSLRDTLGPLHPFTLQSMYGLGNDYWKLNRLEEAEELLVQTVRGQTDVIGEEHRDTLDSWMILANVYADQNKLDQAMATMESALQASIKTLGKQHRDTLSTAHNLATIYDDLGQIHKAIELEEETLEICRNSLPPDDGVLLGIASNLAMSYLDSRINRHEDALALAEEAVRGRIANGAGEYLSHAQNTLAHCYAALGRLEDAKEMHELALASRLEVFGEDHEDTLMCRKLLQEIEEKIAQSSDPTETDV